MKRLFADSYWFLALFNDRDAGHQRAVAVSALLRAEIVTTHWVLVEVADAMSGTSSRLQVSQRLRSLQSREGVRLLPVSMDQFDAGLLLFESRSDKAWSLTDCISFSVMMDLGLTEALTGDRHFEQAGFVALLL